MWLIAPRTLVSLRSGPLPKRGRPSSRREERRLDAEGLPVRGERKINAIEASIVCRIFNDYAAVSWRPNERCG
jgi:hypothetical protein